MRGVARAAYTGRDSIHGTNDVASIAPGLAYSEHTGATKNRTGVRLVVAIASRRSVCDTLSEFRKVEILIRGETDFTFLGKANGRDRLIAVVSDNVVDIGKRIEAVHHARVRSGLSAEPSVLYDKDFVADPERVVNFFGRLCDLQSDCHDWCLLLYVVPSEGVVTSGTKRSSLIPCGRPSLIIEAPRAIHPRLCLLHSSNFTRFFSAVSY